MLQLVCRRQLHSSSFMAIVLFCCLIFLPPVITSCLPLPASPNVLSDASNNFSIGAVVHFNCISSEFSLNGSSVALCQSDGTWNTTIPTCVRKQPQCPEIKLDEHTSASSTNRSISAEVTLTCDEGYEMDGEKTLQTLHCMQNATWNATTPKCVSTTTPSAPMTSSAPKTPSAPTTPSTSSTSSPQTPAPLQNAPSQGQFIL